MHKKFHHLSDLWYVIQELKLSFVLCHLVLCMPVYFITRKISVAKLAITLNGFTAGFINTRKDLYRGGVEGWRWYEATNEHHCFQKLNIQMA